MTAYTRRTTATVFALAATALLAGCAYYNTFYNAQALYKDGAKLVAAGNRAQAKDKFEKAIKKSATVIKSYPKSQWVDDALFLIGMSYYQLGDYTKAIVKFENLDAAFPKSEFRDEAGLYHALALIDDKQYAKGIAILRQLQEDSRAWREEASLQLAVTLLKQEDYRGAIQAFAAFEKGFPASGQRREVWRWLAESYFALGRHEDAAQAYCEHRKLAEHHRERVPDDLKIAECYLLGGRADSTLAIMQRQGDRYPEFSDRINLLAGKAFLAMGKKNEAYSALSKVRSGIAAAEAYLLIGKSYEQDTGFTRALAYYDTAKLRDPNSSYGAQAGQRRLLIDRMLNGLKGATDTAEAQFLLAEVYHLNLEQDSMALVRYQKVADSFPKSPYAAKALYAIAWIKGHSLHQPDSLLAYGNVISRYPKTIYAQAARRVLGQPLLPEGEIEKPPPPKKPVADTLAGHKSKAESLAKSGGQIAEGKTPSGSERAEERRRGRRERGEKGERERPVPPDTALGRHPGTMPGMPVTPPPEETPAAKLPTVPPAKSETARKEVTTPQVPPAVKETIPAKPPPAAIRPETTATPKPQLPKTESLAPQVKRETAIVSPEPRSGDTIPNLGGLGHVPRSGRTFERDTNLRAAYFEFDRAVIRGEDTFTLKTDIEYLERHPELQVQLVGYCDPIGSREYNEVLGWRRAEAVRRWLIKRGIDANRIETQSMGSESVWADDPEFYWLERRVEFHVR
jgi:outer membrane protein OmpA-like peptidoglycan-associated protein/TolA-binding protein